MAKVKKIKDSVPVDKATYYSDAQATCSCGATFNMGSTQKKIKVEVCSNCHPFYTGTQKLVDTSGRLDKFKARLAKKQQMDKSKKPKLVKKDNNKTEKGSKKGDK